jgi:exodeoxyribonuclease VII large subunit
MQLDDLVSRMKMAIDQSVQKYTHKLEIVETKIAGLNPKGILDRGYTIIQDQENNVITNLKKFNKLTKDKKVSIQFSDGTAQLLKDY